MNKRLIFFIILTGFVQGSFAQSLFKDSTEAYNYWAKRGVIEATYAYMQDYITTVGESAAKNEIVGKDKYFEAFIQDIDLKETLPTFTQISKFLNENYWSGTRKKLFVPLKKNFESKIPLNESFFRCTKPGSNDLVTVIPGRNNNHDYWNEKTKEIVLKYNQSLSAFHQEAKKLIENKSESVKIEDKIPKKDLQPKLTQKRNTNQILSNTIFLYGGVFITGLMIGGLFIFLITKNKIKSIVNEEDERKYNDYSQAGNNKRFLFGYLRVVFCLQKQKSKYKKECQLANTNRGSGIDDLRKKISSLEKKTKELSEENADLKKRVEQKFISKDEGKADTYNALSESALDQPTKQIKKIYFSMPESDGSFLISNGEISNDGKKYFKIEFKESSTKGELFYLSGDRDQRAINRLESYLKPVCDIENITNSSTATKIGLIHSGKVTRLNDRWMIDTENKIKIKLY
ncbi:hypothetical protein ACT3CD_14810 [Geofilum sp. OHC36d9]|uniref:hypothetical protein n=1 Tax=Geofilum sp. OHC36d9 TaxID=3458413 RepID=UPI0040341F43